MLLNEGTDLLPASNDVQLLVPIAVTASDYDLAQCLEVAQKWCCCWIRKDDLYLLREGPKIRLKLLPLEFVLHCLNAGINVL